MGKLWLCQFQRSPHQNPTLPDQPNKLPLLKPTAVRQSQQPRLRERKKRCFDPLAFVFLVKERQRERAREREGGEGEGEGGGGGEGEESERGSVCSCVLGTGLTWPD